MRLYKATLTNQSNTVYRYIYMYCASPDRAKEMLEKHYDYQSFIKAGAHLQSLGEVISEQTITQE